MTNEWIEASAPGRLDVMGGIADYSGSLVLQKALQQHTHVQLRLRHDDICTIRSARINGPELFAEFNYRDILKKGEVDFDFARDYFRKRAETHWAAYVLGCILVLQREFGITFRGADIKVSSDVPLGKGVSSSAALELATMKAMAKASSLRIDGITLCHMAQKAENLVAGAPCGLMDQLACYFGNHHQLLPIVCQPDIAQQSVNIPRDICFIGIDSGVKHSVAGSDYGNVRCAAFMGYSIILHSLGIDSEEIKTARDNHNTSSLPFGGYLCNIPVDEFETRFGKLLPPSMTGREFIEHFGVTTDQATLVSADAEYNVYQCTAHPVHEHARVTRFLELIKYLNTTGASDNAAIAELGLLMKRSHESYSRCGLGSARTDEIVEITKRFRDKGIAGAKITGGGSGGTVCLLAVGDRGKESARQIRDEMQVRYQQTLEIFE